MTPAEGRKGEWLRGSQASVSIARGLIIKTRSGDKATPVKRIARREGDGGLVGPLQRKVAMDR